MDLAFVYGPVMLGDRYIDFDNLFSSDRGLTGSELSCIMYSKEMAALGHKVTLYCPSQTPFNLCKQVEWQGVRLKEITYLTSSKHQVYYVWNEPDTFRVVPKTSLRILNQQVNDFSYTTSNFYEYVDIYTSPSYSHREHIKQFTPKGSRWEVIYNGCDPDIYNLDS